MTNDILHADIITTCLRQYLFTIGVSPTEMVFSSITLLTDWQLTRESLHDVWHGTKQLVHNNNLTEAEASTFIVNIFGDIMLPCRTPSSCENIVLSNLTLHFLPIF